MTAHLPHRHLHALMVDDNPADCLLAQEAFELQAAQVSVKIIQDGAAALTWLRAQGARHALPDVILLDINMPGLSGFEVLAAIRADLTLRHLPVVMLTTSDRPQDIDQAYELIVSSYLVKQPEFSGFVVQVEDFVRFWSEVRYRQRLNPPN
ncbi:response regulator [Deinococcus radiotolerans]|uniref:Response regulator n=1 Tax=Deinococcus radiotolerans TaxID=1309407 RepID=A0ABQ2FMI7_9DEIO|nr:response regulator [Deinococcus radiotolerans]GGL08493.1 response regulator [Deinococcus radiotolerans]